MTNILKSLSKGLVYKDWVYTKDVWCVTIHAYVGKDACVTIPKEIDGKSVRVINHLAFSPKNWLFDKEQKKFLKEGLCKVIVSKEVIVNSLAFAGCTNLEIENIENLEIKDDNLDRYTKPDLVLVCPDCPKILKREKRAGQDGVFKGVGGLGRGTVVISEEYHTVASGALVGRNFSGVYICEGVEKIESGAFVNLEHLEYVYLPKTLKSLPENAFINCPNIPQDTLKNAQKVQEWAEATLSYSCEWQEADSSFITTCENTFEIDRGQIAKKLPETDILLLDLTPDGATVYITRFKHAVKLSFGSKIILSLNESSSGGIIEDSRYYDYDYNYTYTFELSKKQRS